MFIAQGKRQRGEDDSKVHKRQKVDEEAEGEEYADKPEGEEYREHEGDEEGENAGEGEEVQYAEGEHVEVILNH